MRAGTLLMTWVGVAYLSRIVPELEAVSLPFVFPNREVAFKVMDGEVGVLLDKKLAEKNFISLGWMDLGPRQFTNSKRPIKTIDDFKGLKVRLQPNETHLATFRALGRECGGDGREGALLGARAEGHGRAGEPLHDHPRRALHRGPEVPLQHRAFLRLHRDHRQPQAVRGAQAGIPEGDPRGDATRRSRISASSPSTPIAKHWTRSARRCSTTRSPRRSASRCAR